MGSNRMRGKRKPPAGAGGSLPSLTLLGWRWAIGFARSAGTIHSPGPEFSFAEGVPSPLLSTGAPHRHKGYAERWKERKCSWGVGGGEGLAAHFVRRTIWPRPADLPPHPLNRSNTYSMPKAKAVQ